MILIDTSIWIHVFRDKTQHYAKSLSDEIGAHELVLTRFQQLELLQGCRDEREWDLLSVVVAGRISDSASARLAAMLGCATLILTVTLCRIQRA
ncbi:MAG: hypothetical protein ACRESZ_02290 [Methylococcales bacterium]